MMQKNSWRMAWLALVLTLPGIVRADLIVFAVTTQNEFGTLDLQTGAFTLLGTVSGIAGGYTGDITRLPEGLIYGIDSSSRLVLINPVDGTTSIVGNPGHSIFGLSFRQDGTLFGNSRDQLFTIDPNTGTATLVGVMGSFGGSYYGVKFDGSGHLYLFENAGGSASLYTVNTSTGLATLVGGIGFDVWDTDYENGTLYGLTTDKKIISINTTTGAGTLVAGETYSNAIVAVATGGASLGAPLLTIQPTNVNSAALSWIAPSNAFSLQQNPDLTTTNWATVTNSVNVTNSLNQVIVSPAVGNNFYRLVNP